MTLGYDLELVAVECERLVQALAAIAGGPGGVDRLNDVERECWDGLRQAALRGREVFSAASRGVSEES